MGKFGDEKENNLQVWLKTYDNSKYVYFIIKIRC